MRRTPVKTAVIVLACLVLVSARAGVAQQGAVNPEWRHYGGDVGGTKYSPWTRSTRQT